jgi:uncharacterized protein DUF981
MIMFNTTIGVAAGAALLLVPRCWAAMRGDRMPMQLVRGSDPAGWSAAFGILGAILAALSFTMTVTHPLAEAKPFIDTLFGEPSLVLGVVLLAAAWRLSRRDPVRLDAVWLRRSLEPTTWIVFLLGVVLAWCTAAIVRFNAISSAPAEEPISGLLHAWPIVENTFFAVVLYGPAALGALLMPFANRAHSRWAWPVLYWSWTISGLGFALFSAMNFYTHTGLILNLTTSGPDFRW